MQDGSLVLGTMLLAASSIGLGSCWINRAKESFQSEEGKALMRKWGLGDKYEGIGICILGYVKGRNSCPEGKKKKTISSWPDEFKTSKQEAHHELRANGILRRGRARRRNFLGKPGQKAL